MSTEDRGGADPESGREDHRVQARPRPHGKGRFRHASRAGPFCKALTPPSPCIDYAQHFLYEANIISEI